MKRVLAIVTVAGSVISLPSPADAHMMSTGLGPFYDGLAHLFVTPEDLLPVAALALLAGLRGAAWGRAVLLGLPAAWLAGSMAGALVTLPPLPAAVAAAATVVVGVLVAVDARVSVALLSGGAVAFGLSAAGETSLALVPPVTASLFAAGGTVSTFVVVSLLAGQVGTLKAHSARIAVRVAGSWIAAIGLLALGWALR